MRISDWAAALLCCAALVAVWPATGRSRWRMVLGGGGRTRDGAAGHGATGRSGLPAVTPRPGGLARPAALLTAWLGGSPHRLTLLSCVVGGVAGAAIAGPVAGTVAATYGGLAAHLALGRRAARAAARERRHRLDRLGAMAADLRAGLPSPGPGSIVAVPGTRLPDGASDPAVNGDGIGNGDGDGDGDGDGIGEGDGDGNGRIGSLVRAAARLAERTGAPLADLLDRIEADARATDRGLAAAEAQAAGARATAWLLAVLPVGGIALGYAIRVDPLAVLLHTPIGAGCAIAALLLQLGGLAWSNRLSATARRVP